jgi:bacteriorhodopsin
VKHTWLWLVIPGVFLLFVGLIGWISDDSPFWYVLLGLSNVIIGVSLRRRRIPDPERER